MSMHDSPSFAVVCDRVTVDEDTAPAPIPRSGPIWIAAFVGLVVCTNIAAASWVTMDDEHPASLLLLSSRNRFLVATVPSGISPFEWALIACLRLSAAAIVCHMLGRAYGDQALRWFWKFMGMPQEQVSKFEKAVDNAEWFVVPFFVGSNIVWVLSGAAKTTWKRLLPLAAVGMAMRLALLWWLSKEFESELRSTLKWLDHYQWWILIGSVLIVVLVNVRNFRGR
ncbi:unannotated protein [freshwater metagenome]|uniref:Unannotated protein n=1 Tax=freshwater metagenome TaxID=449393 RepID=A0A6J6A7P8_9ZZZZ